MVSPHRTVIRIKWDKPKKHSKLEMASSEYCYYIFPRKKEYPSCFLLLMPSIFSHISTLLSYVNLIGLFGLPLSVFYFIMDSFFYPIYSSWAPICYIKIIFFHPILLACLHPKPLILLSWIVTISSLVSLAPACHCQINFTNTPSDHVIPLLTSFQCSPITSIKSTVWNLTLGTFYSSELICYCRFISHSFLIYRWNSV